MADAKENLFILTPLNFKDGRLDSETKAANSSSKLVDKYDPLVVCRTCANMDPCLVPIFKEEGLDYSLDKKIEKYLPIQISEDDDLPLHLCYHCASTLIAWDTLFIGCVEAEKKLNLWKNSLRNKQCDVVAEDVDVIINEDIDSDDEPLITKKMTSGVRKVEEKRDILTEKNGLQTLEQMDIESERLREEPDLSFSTYQDLFTARRPFIFDIFKLRINDPLCCNMCIAVETFKLAFIKPLREKSSAPNSPSVRNVDAQTGGSDSANSDMLVRKKKRKRLKSTGRVACDVCGKMLSCKISLYNHMKVHDSENKLTCDECGRDFRHRVNLIRHLRVVHEGIRNHVCVDCGKRYRSHWEMEDHRNIHSVQHKIICDVCGRIFLTKSSFYAHKTSHRMKKSNPKKSNVQFDCEECHKKFTSKKSRDQHLLIHTGEKPLACTICGKKFRTKTKLSKHVVVHSNVKPFGCEFCGKAFRRKDHLTVHTRCHTGEKPFICNYCGRGFTQMIDMKRHCVIHTRSQ